MHGPGASDNAAAVGLLLTLARRDLSRIKNYNIRLILFGAEEIGMVGSTYYVENMSNIEKSMILGMINLDTIFGGDYLYIHASHPTKLKLRDDLLSKSKELTLNFRTHRGMGKMEQIGGVVSKIGSDYKPFKVAGIPTAYIESTNFEIPPYDGYTQVEQGEVKYFMNSPNDSARIIDNLYPGRRVEQVLEVIKLIRGYLLE